MFPVNNDPQTTNNNVNLDASQLRGIFNFNVDAPIYVQANQIVNDLNTFGAYFGPTKPTTSFGQTTINLSKTNRELTTTLNGTVPINTSNFNIIRKPDLQVRSPIIRVPKS